MLKGTGFFKSIAFVAALCIPAVAPFAAGYPERPTHVIVPYAPAGGADSFARSTTVDLENARDQEMSALTDSESAGMAGILELTEIKIE